MAARQRGKVAVIPELQSGGQHSCLASAEILGCLGDKWTIMVLGALTAGPVRFNVLLRTIEGVSHRMLTLTLRRLQRDGLVARRVYDTSPISVDYDLTELGMSLVPHLRALIHWADGSKSCIMDARDTFDRRAENA